MMPLVTSVHRLLEIVHLSESRESESFSKYYRQHLKNLSLNNTSIWLLLAVSNTLVLPCSFTSRLSPPVGWSEMKWLRQLQRLSGLFC